MPQDRLLHPRASRSQKVSSLSDLEYRVWVQYLLSADDFGVLRASAVALQADNDALAARPAPLVQRAVDRLVTLGLVRTFAHQGQTFIYQTDWQSFQKVEYPRATLEPKPPVDALDACADTTRDLFEKHPGGLSKKLAKPPQKFGEHSPNIPQTVAESSPSVSQTFGEHSPNGSQRVAESSPTVSPSLSEEFPSNARARPRETAKANGIRLTARSSETADFSDEVAARAAALLEAYRAWFTECRSGARLRLTASPVDWAKACDLCALWDDPTLEKLARIFLTTDDDWISQTGREFSVFALKASWCDGRLREWETKQKALARA